MIIRPRNWKSFQHYNKRSPPWIKLHRELLDNYDYHRLPDASAALAPKLWLMASESSDGSIDADPDKLAFRLRRTPAEINAALRPLIAAKFFEVVEHASDPLAEGKQSALSEREGETEKEGEGEARARGVPRGTQDAGTNLTGMPAAEDALDELRDNWLDVEGVEPIAMRQWLVHWSRVHGDKEMPIHQRIATAKLLRGLGDSDTQIRAVVVAEAAGWKALRPGDGRKPPPRKGEVDPSAKAASEAREWETLGIRAQAVGFRARMPVDDLGGYRALVERAECEAPRGGRVLAVAELLKKVS